MEDIIIRISVEDEKDHASACLLADSLAEMIDGHTTYYATAEY